MVERTDINCVYTAPYWRRDVRFAYPTRATQQGARFLAKPKSRNVVTQRRLHSRQDFGFEDSHSKFE